VEELGQLVIAIIFILFYVISGSKRKKKSAPSPPVADGGEDVESETLVVKDEWEEPDKVPERLKPPVERKRSLSEELFAMLQDQPPPQPVDVVDESQVDDEARSLEVLEPFAVDDGVEDRRDVSTEETPVGPYAVEQMGTDRPYALDESPEERPYLVETPKDPEPYAISDLRKRKRDLTRSELRHAFVMREVLGPPKALEE